MTPKKFRQLALSLPNTSECGTTSHPDYRVSGTTFASLCPGGDWAVLKLTREHQAELLDEAPGVYEVCNGAWGKNGATLVMLRDAEEGRVLGALICAWRKHAPDSLTEDFDDGRM